MRDLAAFYESLKPGMSVKIREDLKPGNLYSTKIENPSIVSEMADRAGQICTITHVYKRTAWYNVRFSANDTYADLEYKWPDTAFVPIKRPFNRLLEKAKEYRD